MTRASRQLSSRPIAGGLGSTEAARSPTPWPADTVMPRSAMAKCGYCNSTVMLGLRDGDQRFCNNKCKQNAYVLRMSRLVAEEMLEREVEAIHRGNCPKCNLPGPVDMHKYYEVLSLIVLTRWTTKQQLSC